MNLFVLLLRFWKVSFQITLTWGDPEEEDEDEVDEETRVQGAGFEIPDDLHGFSTD